jgi:hypothetical protein
MLLGAAVESNGEVWSVDKEAEDGPGIAMAGVTVLDDELVCWAVQVDVASCCPKMGRWSR